MPVNCDANPRAHLGTAPGNLVGSPFHWLNTLDFSPKKIQNHGLSIRAFFGPKLKVCPNVTLSTWVNRAPRAWHAQCVSCVSSANKHEKCVLTCAVVSPVFVL